MEKIFCGLCPGQRPVIFVAPLIRSHDEEVDPLVGSELVLHALEQVVVPLQFPFILRLFCIWPEINVADLGHGAGVSTDHDHQVLAFARRFTAAVVADALIILQRSSEEQVVPGCDVQGGNGDVGEVLLN